MFQYFKEETKKNYGIKMENAHKLCCQADYFEPPV
jgi:hypothetical protein